ncbi:MAG: transketolase [Ruminococcaceae bacterium]|nr:transketolase [Oscillospiraceae bacterium]
MTNKKLSELKKISLNAKLLALEGIYNAQSGHPGGSLSATDVLTYLYFEKMNINPADPDMKKRDRFVLSKGHACPALYSVLALRGFFDTAELKDLRKLGSMLQGHPSMHEIPGIDMSTGSLGQGFSAACGIALREKREKLGFRTYAMIGDGESQEGQIWEASMFASHYKLSKLTLFVDFNKLQIDGEIKKVMNPGKFEDKFAAFGWHVQTINGHSFKEIEKAVENAEKSNQPSVIICKTVKGKGVSFMENNAGWHGKAPKAEEYEKAVAELKTQLDALS